MRFTSMFRYGLRALSILAQNYGKGPVSAREISERENLSPSFLEQLLAQLRRNGIVKGIRGPGGGFELTKHPSKIKINDILEALEGPVCVSRCIRPAADPTAEQCDRFEDCPAVPLLKKLDRDISKILDTYKLTELI
jgi:Rrf2 family cysteine metabolism transcriptional repressor